MPLTHHEIVELVEPFARRGRRADLAASDRLARKVVFAPRDHDDARLAYREVLELDTAEPGRARLTRRLSLAGGLAASLRTEGSEPAALLARIEAVAADRQLRRAGEFALALDQRVDADGTLRFERGTTRAGGLVVSLTRSSRDGRDADVALSTTLDDPLELPDDFVAVLGWDWSRVERRSDRTERRWTGRVRLRGRDRDADAERKLERLASHVATTLSCPPPAFHDLQRAARWAFAFRRAIPFLVSLALIAASFVFTKAAMTHDSIVRMLVFNAPPLMLVAFFCLRDLPRFEWPTWPRRPKADRWR